MNVCLYSCSPLSAPQIATCATSQTNTQHLLHNLPPRSVHSGRKAPRPGIWSIGSCYDLVHPMSSSRNDYSVTLDAPNQNNVRCSKFRALEITERSDGFRLTDSHRRKRKKSCTIARRRGCYYGAMMRVAVGIFCPLLPIKCTFSLCRVS